MLSSFGLNQATGVYTVAYRIVDIATIPIFSLHDAALPRFFQLGRDGISEGRKMAFQLLRRVVPFAGLTAAVLFFAAPILPRFVGGGFTESISALRWLCLIPVFRSVHNISGAALTGAGLQRYRTGSQVFSAVLNFALNLWAIRHYGWLGAAWSSLITDGSLAALNWMLLLKLQHKGLAYGSLVQNSAAPA
jgi:O-antigen/teichoic acid export membrane protein